MWRVAGSRSQQRGLRIGELDRGVGFQPAFVAGELSDRLEAYPTGAERREHHHIERGTAQSEMVESGVEEPVRRRANRKRLFSAAVIHTLLSSFIKAMNMLHTPPGFREALQLGPAPATLQHEWRASRQHANTLNRQRLRGTLTDSFGTEDQADLRFTI